MDYTTAAATITGVLTSAAGIMMGVIGVYTGFWGFHQIKKLVGR